MALLKLSLMAFSFVFWAAGLAMFILGMWAELSLDTYLVLSTNEYPNISVIFLATGTTVIVWSFLGCFGVATEHCCLLRIYGGVQLAVLAAGIAAGLSALFFRKDIAEGLQNGLQEAIHAYAEDEEKAEALDSIQRTLDCCGVDSYQDWFASPWSMEQQVPNGSVPMSCCRAHRSCAHSPLPLDTQGIYHDGCFSKVYDFVNDNMFYIGTTALGVALMQVVGIVMACRLATRLLPHADPPGGATPCWAPCSSLCQLFP